MKTWIGRPKAGETSLTIAYLSFRRNSWQRLINQIEYTTTDEGDNRSMSAMVRKL